MGMNGVQWQQTQQATTQQNPMQSQQQSYAQTPHQYEAQVLQQMSQQFQQPVPQQYQHQPQQQFNQSQQQQQQQQQQRKSVMPPPPTFPAMSAVPRYQNATPASKAKNAEKVKRAQTSGRKPSTIDRQPPPANNAQVNSNGVPQKRSVAQLQSHPPPNGQMLPPPVPKSASRSRPRKTAAPPAINPQRSSNGVPGDRLIDPQLHSQQPRTGQAMPPPAPRPSPRSLPQQSAIGHKPTLKAPGPLFDPASVTTPSSSHAQYNRAPPVGLSENKSIDPSVIVPQTMDTPPSSRARIVGRVAAQPPVAAATPPPPVITAADLNKSTNDVPGVDYTGAQILHEAGPPEGSVEAKPSFEHPLGRAGNQGFWKNNDEYVTHLATISELLERTKKMARTVIDHDAKTANLSRKSKAAKAQETMSEVSKAFRFAQTGYSQGEAPTTLASSDVMDLFHHDAICDELQIEVDIYLLKRETQLDFNDANDVQVLRQEALKAQLKFHRVINTVFANAVSRIIMDNRNPIELVQGQGDFGETVAAVHNYESAIQAVCGGYATTLTSLNYHDPLKTAIAWQLQRRVVRISGDQLEDEPFIKAFIETAKAYRNSVETANIRNAHTVPLRPSLQEDALLHLDDIDEQAENTLRYVLSKQGAAAAAPPREDPVVSTTDGQQKASTHLNVQEQESQVVENASLHPAKATHIRGTTNSEAESRTASKNTPAPSTSRGKKRRADEIPGPADENGIPTDGTSNKRQKQKDPETEVSFVEPLVPVSPTPVISQGVKRGLQQVTEAYIFEDSTAHESPKKRQKLRAADTPVLTLQDDDETFGEQKASTQILSEATTGNHFISLEEGLMQAVSSYQPGIGLDFDRSLFENIDVVNNDPTFDALFEQYMADNGPTGEEIFNQANYNYGNAGDKWGGEL